MGCISTDTRGSSPPQAARDFFFSPGFMVADFGCRDSGGFSFASMLCLCECRSSEDTFVPPPWLLRWDFLYQPLHDGHDRTRLCHSLSGDLIHRSAQGGWGLGLSHENPVSHRPASPWAQGQWGRFCETGKW